VFVHCFGDREGRMKLAGYVLHAPIWLAKMSDDAATGPVSYRSKSGIESPVVSRHFDVTGIADRLGADVTCFPAQCSAALNQRETVANDPARETSRIEFLIV